MNAPTIVAIVAIVAGAAATVGNTFVQGRVAQRNATNARVGEASIAAYTDAMVRVQRIEDALARLVEHPDSRSSQTPPTVSSPPDYLITARLRLVAPGPIWSAWQELINAWETLCWTLEDDGPVNDFDDYHVDESSPDVVRIQMAIATMTTTAREAMGVRAVA